MNLNVKSELKPPENFDFPFVPYPIQHNFMKTLYNVLENCKLGIFESPTGTGKSLSIICGSLRWLKDYNEYIRNNLNENIHKLEEEKQELTEDTIDWLNSQAQAIEITKQLNNLKLECKKINEYDENIEKIKNQKKKQLKRKIIPKLVNNENLDIIEDKSDEIDDNIVLEDPVEDNDVDEEMNEEETEKYQSVKIIICSRTHSQLSQFVGEIRRSPFGENIRVVSLASRQNYCINPEVTRLKNVNLINERCLDMQKKQSKVTKKDDDGKVTKRKKESTCHCSYYKQTSIDELSDHIVTEIQDVEDLVDAGKQINACPYYASRKAVELAQVILIPYNTLLHKATREANGIKIKNNIVIVDEAHNLLDALAQMHSSEINYEHLFYSHLQLKQYKDKYGRRLSSNNLLRVNQLLFVISKLLKLFDKKDESNNDKTKIFSVQRFVSEAEINNYNIFDLLKFIKSSKIAQKLHSFAKYFTLEESNTKINEKGVKQFLSSIENKQQSKPLSAVTENTTEKNIPSNPLLIVASFLETLTNSCDDGRILLNKDERKIKYLLLNPASHFQDIVKDARSVVVAGGTMKPIEEFRDRLFKSAGATYEQIIEFSCDHIIPQQNILPIILTKGLNQTKLLFNYANRLSMGDNLKYIIKEVCNLVKGGIVVFFPSYNYESWFWQQVQNISFNRPVFREPKESSSVDSVLTAYAKTIKKPSNSGALLFSVVGGKLSEGLNFSDDLGRCIIVVGLPYANIKALDLNEKMKYLDKNEGTGAGQKFYENLCMKSVNQCIGRAVRHKNDYATVLLLDERYNRVSTKNALPDWIKRSLKVGDFKDSFNLVKKFFEEKKSTL